MTTDNKTFRVSDLDFQSIKSNLITFMQAQDSFVDYNFAGSAMNTLIDLLAYNTYYNSIQANMLSNECFLDSAVLRGSVVSHAKALGYYPTSYKSSVANVTITASSLVGSPTSVILPKGYQFTSIIDSKTYKFTTLDSYEVAPVGTTVTFSNIPLYEGTLNTYSYVVDTTNLSQKFIIPSQTVDLSTLIVRVQNSSSDTTLTLFTESTDITKVTATSTVYYIQGTSDNKYEIYFGDDILGKSVIDGNIVILEYVIASGSITNNAKIFRSVGTIGGSSSIAISTIDIASGGTEYESLNSIKLNAPKAFSAQNRMFTIEDVRTLLPMLYSNIKSVSVWGGEENIPPNYGVVYISIEPLNYGLLTVSEKDYISNSILNEKKMISIQYEIIDPEYIFININSTVYYDQTLSLYGTDSMKILAKNAIMIYNNNELGKFKGVFRFSKLSTAIDNVDKSIISNITIFTLKKYLIPIYGTSTTYEMNFYNPIYKNTLGNPEGSVSSTGFTITGDSTVYYFDDDGSKYIRMYYLDNTTKIYTNNNIGTVDYATGRVLITLNISTFIPLNPIDLGIGMVIKTQSNDIIPVRNMILRILEEDITANAVVDTISDGNKSGANYVFTPSR